MRDNGELVLILSFEVGTGLFNGAHRVLESFLLATDGASWLGETGRLLVSTNVSCVFEITVSLSRVFKLAYVAD